MHLLILGTIAYSFFIITVRASQRNSCNILAVGMVNYVVASTVYCLLSRDAQMPDTGVVALGLAGGVVFAIGFMVLTRTLRSRESCAVARAAAAERGFASTACTVPVRRARKSSGIFGNCPSDLRT